MSATTLEHSPMPNASKLPWRPVGPPTAPDFATRKWLKVEGPFQESRPTTMIPIRLDTSEQIFQREKAAFSRLKESLVDDPNYLNKFVAIMNGNVADSDYDRSALVERIYTTYGYVPLFIGKVTREKRYRQLPSSTRM